MGDKTKLYDETRLDNPSLPLSDIMERMASNNALLAIAPGSFTNELYAQVQNISAFVLAQTGGLYSESIKLFESKDQMDDYITNKDYDDEGYGQGKIGLGNLC